MRVPTFMSLSAVALLAACGGSSGPTGPSGPPAITVVNGATLPSGTIGATVVIEGYDFGTSQSVASGHVVFSTTAGGRDTAVIASAADWTNLLIVTIVPAGVPLGRDTLFVETSGGTSTPIVFTVVAKVAFSPSTVSWTATTALPVGLSGHAVARPHCRGSHPRASSMSWAGPTAPTRHATACCTQRCPTPARSARGTRRPYCPRPSRTRPRWWRRPAILPSRAVRICTSSEGTAPRA